jgi:hypothetical protein
MFSDYEMFESPETVAIAIGLLVFIAALQLLKKSFGRDNTAIAAIVSLLLGILTSWKIYTSDFTYSESFLLYLFIILGLAVIWVIVLRPFFRYWRRR